MVLVIRAVEGTDREDLLEVRRRVAAVHAGQRLLAIGDVAAILLVVRAPDRHLRFERQVEEGPPGVVQRLLSPFGHTVIADHEEADLAADVVELAGGVGHCSRVRTLEALQIKDGNAAHRPWCLACGRCGTTQCRDHATALAGCLSGTRDGIIRSVARRSTSRFARISRRIIRLRSDDNRDSGAGPRPVAGPGRS